MSELPVESSPRHHGLEPGAVGGLLLGVLVLLAAMVTAADIGPFVHLPSILIVVGGSICAAIVSFPLRQLSSAWTVLRQCLRHHRDDSQLLVVDFVHYAEIARREGMLAVEHESREIADSFLVSALHLAVDGREPAEIESLLLTETDAAQERFHEVRGLFEALGRYAPAFGMIGTLVGLVGVLRNMADPASIGPGVAVALLTTLYGAVLANLVALPLADLIARRSQQDLRRRMMVIRGAVALQAGEHPRIVERRLRSFLAGRTDDGDPVREAA